MQSKIIKKVKSFLSYSLKLFILTSFLLSQSFIAEIFLYQNHPDTKSINTAKANYSDHWYNTNWSYRKPITINHTNIPHTDTNNPNAYLSDFPVLVSTTIPTDKARSDHNDIVFASCDASSCTVLSYEIESYNTTNGNLTAWVKVPQLNDVNNTTDTSFYMYYGNSSHSTSDLENKTAVWDDGGGAGGNHFKMVQHLGGNIANSVAGHLDSTQYANNGTPNNFNGISTSTTNGTGQIAGADVFDGTNDYVNVGNGSSLNITNAITIEFWGQSGLAKGGIVDKFFNSTGILVGLWSGTVRYKINGGGEISTGITLTDLSHVAITSDGNTVKAYLNGALVHTNAYPYSLTTNTRSLYLGFDQNVHSTDYYQGILDEVRISDIVRSADWIKTGYNNQSSPSNFHTLESEENILPTVLAEVTPIPTPSNGSNLSYTFSSTKVGTIVYGQYCSSSTTTTVAGNNTIVFNTLPVGTHFNCTIQVTDVFGVVSNILTVSSFTIDNVPLASWYSSSWLYRRQITTNHTKVPHTGSTTSLSNFPVLVSIINDNNLKASAGKVKTDGSDIIFTPQSCVSLEHCNPLNYEIESYDKDNGNLTAWVKIPTLYDASGSQDTIVYMYYGNSGAVANTQTNITAVWDTDFKGVWHLGDTPTGHAIGDYKDSTQYANNSTNISNEPVVITGRIDGAQSFDGTSSYIDMGNNSSLNITNAVTIEFWGQSGLANGGIVDKFYNSTGILVGIWGGAVRYRISGGGEISTGITLNNLSHVAITSDGNTVKAYLNGVLVHTNAYPYSLTTNTRSLYLGFDQNAHGADYYQGILDEVRISDAVRSADWIKTGYNNQSSPGSFYGLGEEESNMPPVLAELVPVTSPSNNSIPSYTFSSTKAGIITYGGDCSSVTNSVVLGDNTIIFNTLTVGAHSNCTIKATDGFGNESNTLAITAFTVSSAFTVYVVPAITDNKILPKSSISSSYISDTTFIEASPGEYKAASFVINSNYGIGSLKVETSDLTGNGNTIADSAVDIKTVKCWYQGNYGMNYSAQGRYLTPELLLKDDSLVNVEGDNWNQWYIPNSNGKNYLKLTDGSYIDISSDTPQRTTPYVIPIADRPIQDAATLQPVALPANYNKQFWITLHIPDNTPAGDYTGTISLKNGTQTIKSLNVDVQVLPINLPQPDIEYSIYYYGQIYGNGSISYRNKTVAQFTAEQVDMYQHGIINPNIYQFSTDSNLLQALSIRQQVGMDNTNFYGKGSIASSDIPYYKNLTAPYGVVNFYQYGPEETDINDIVHRTQMNNEHIAGGRHFNALTLSQADSVADILDLAIVSLTPNPTLAAKYHSYGHKVYSYANPQAVPEYPGTFRMNYGLALWQGDYDGAMDFAYQMSFGDIWNDFDEQAWRDHVFAYPTMNGVIDTVEWEGFREGVNDMRYLTALQNAITVAKNQGDDTTAIEAENYLKNLKKSNLAGQDLDTVRSQIIDYILAFQSSSHSLIVNHGAGSGLYTNNSKVTIMADVSQTDLMFNKWVGDTQYISNVNAATTIVTMPSRPISLTATYTSPWYDSNYSYRKSIIIDHTKVSGSDQSNFPVLVSLTDTSLKNITKGGKVQNLNGYDIIFTLPDGTLLNYETESYDNTTGKLVVWVKITSISVSADTIIYMYYDNSNSASSQENQTSVWDSDFKGVWHMNQDPSDVAPQMEDSTVNYNNGTMAGNMTSQQSVAGQVANATNFIAENNNYIDAGNNSSLNITNAVTIEFWGQSGLAKGGIVDKFYNSTGILVGIWGGTVRYRISGGAETNTSITLTDLSHVAITSDGNTVKAYLNGVLVHTNAYPYSLTTNTRSLYLGFDQNVHSTDYYQGILDEVRISSVARSSDWIKTEYNNESNPNTFSTLSPEENLLPPTITSLSANLPTGTYGTGTTVPITINFSKDVTSTGNITLTLNTDPQRTCSFTITNNNSATCNYTIQGGDSATNLNATISGTVHDQFNNPLTNFTPLSNLSDNTTININTSSSPFIPPTKPNITNINITVLDNGTTTFNLPSNITQIAISRTPDFANVSWQDFDQDKFSHINETQETLYIKFRTNEGAVSDTIIITPQSSINNTTSLIDGDIIQCKSSNDPNAVYIVKIIGTKTYIRHITSIQIFNYYKHLKWENLKQVDSLTPFSLSSWIRVNTGTNGLPKAGDKVYEINGDQSKHWINMTSNQFLSHGGSDEAIYTVNTGELNLYSAGADVVSL